MKSQLQQIKDKLLQLKVLDINLQVFGAQSHEYQFNPTKTEAELLAFEQEHNIKLPEDYRAFLKTLGNGGAGPYYGLEPLENGRYVDLDYQREEELIDLSQPFPHTTAWNMDMDLESEEAYDQQQELYYQDKWINGLLRIANFGCGIYINLVVNGQEHGHVWMDDRANGQGILPDSFYKGTQESLGFLDWYECWLDKELEKITA